MITKLITKPLVTVFCLLCVGMMLTSSCNPPLQTVEGDDGSLWERVSQPGFGDDNNSSVVALAEYQGRCLLYTSDAADDAMNV